MISENALNYVPVRQGEPAPAIILQEYLTDFITISQLGATIIDNNTAFDRL
jgi:hypothetical protein